MENIPSAYVDGYVKACAVDKKTADNYIKHTTIGDVELDPVMEEISSLPPEDLHRFIGAGIEQRESKMHNMPQILRDFFETADQDVPPWVDFESFKLGQRAFFRNMSDMLIAYAIGSAVEGFGTLVCKSFSITNRVPGLGPGAERRLRQNNRHMLEIYFPDGLRRSGDGWKISTRIRFVHARIRRLLAESDEWDHEAWGTPLSAAHVGGISLYTFSIRQFEHAISMGASINQEERDSIVKIWRFGGHILGVPEAILFANEAEAKRLYEIAHLCEPPPDNDAVRLANSVFKAIPKMAGMTEEAEIRRLQQYAYRLSRALIGNELADLFDYPNTIRMKQLVLWYYRNKTRLIRLLNSSPLMTEGSFTQIFEATQFDKGGISYKMPDHVKATHQSPW